MLARFAPTPLRPEPDATADPRSCRLLLLVAAGVAVVGSMRPWLQVQFARLFGDHVGPPGWQSSTGFTCLMTSLLVAVLSCVETESLSTQRAARPAGVLLVAIATVAVVLEWLQGPSLLRGVSAQWTWAFWAVLVALPVLLLACFRRYSLVHGR